MEISIKIHWYSFKWKSTLHSGRLYSCITCLSCYMPVGMMFSVQLYYRVNKPQTLIIQYANQHGLSDDIVWSGIPWDCRGNPSWPWTVAAMYLSHIGWPWCWGWGLLRAYTRHSGTGMCHLWHHDITWEKEVMFHLWYYSNTTVFEYSQCWFLNIYRQAHISLTQRRLSVAVTCSAFVLD